MSEVNKIAVLTESELETIIERAVLKALGNGNLSSRHEPDKNLTPAEAAVLLNVSVRWLYRHAKRLPFTKRLSSKCLRFSEAGLLRYRDAKKI
jgi:hypothetical protein